MLSGLAGAILAPVAAITPLAGGQFIVKSFITVVSVGASVITGTSAASLLLGTTGKAMEVLSTPMAGESVLLRLLPQGITGRYFKGAL